MSLILQSISLSFFNLSFSSSIAVLLQSFFQSHFSLFHFFPCSFPSFPSPIHYFTSFPSHSFSSALLPFLPASVLALSTTYLVFTFYVSKSTVLRLIPLPIMYLLFFFFCLFVSKSMVLKTDSITNYALVFFVFFLFSKSLVLRLIPVIKYVLVLFLCFISMFF